MFAIWRTCQFPVEYENRIPEPVRRETRPANVKQKKMQYGGSAENITTHLEVWNRNLLQNTLPWTAHTSPNSLPLLGKLPKSRFRNERQLGRRIMFAGDSSRVSFWGICSLWGSQEIVRNYVGRIESLANQRNAVETSKQRYVCSIDNRFDTNFGNFLYMTTSSR